MKKLLIIAIMIISMFSGASARQETTSINLTVLVQGSFNLMVNTDSFDFYSLMPGQTGDMSRSEGITVAGTSSGGNPWYLKVSTSNPLSSGANYIPNESFTWHGSSEGQGTWYGAEERSISESNGTAYISSVDESDSASRIINKFKFRLHVPEDTKPGEYTTTVMFTMTE